MNTEEIPQEKFPDKDDYPSWPVEFDEKGNLHGLPPGILEKNVLLFKNSDGKWIAQNPSDELRQEIKKWRTDWGGNE